jgi:hypothetical protein
MSRCLKAEIGLRYFFVGIVDDQGIVSVLKFWEGSGRFRGVERVNKNIVMIYKSIS